MVNFAFGYTCKTWLYERKNYAALLQVQLNWCAESFPNNDDSFGSASDGVPQGYQEQKASQFCLTWDAEPEQKTISFISWYEISLKLKKTQRKLVAY